MWVLYGIIFKFSCWGTWEGGRKGGENKKTGVARMGEFVGEGVEE